MKLNRNDCYCEVEKTKNETGSDKLQSMIIFIEKNITSQKFLRSKLVYIIFEETYIIFYLIIFVKLIQFFV